jgi:hypothetical protein
MANYNPDYKNCPLRYNLVERGFDKSKAEYRDKRSDPLDCERNKCMFYSPALNNCSVHAFFLNSIAVGIESSLVTTPEMKTIVAKLHDEIIRNEDKDWNEYESEN